MLTQLSRHPQNVLITMSTQVHLAKRRRGQPLSSQLRGVYTRLFSSLASLSLSSHACVHANMLWHVCILCLSDTSLQSHSPWPVRPAMGTAVLHSLGRRSHWCHNEHVYSHPSKKGDGYCWANTTWMDKVGAWLWTEGIRYSQQCDELKAEHTVSIFYLTIPGICVRNINFLCRYYQDMKPCGNLAWGMLVINEEENQKT